LYYRRIIADNERLSALTIATAKEQLFANVSHEFRTPLTLVLGPAKQLIDESKNAATREKLEVIERNANRLVGMVDQILDLAKLSNNGTNTGTNTGNNNRQLQNLSQLFTDTVHSFQLLIENKKIEFNVEAGSDTEHWVEMVHDSLEKIISNLLINAYKYTPSGGVISVSLSSAKDGKIQITVSDSGMGMKDEDLDGIFNRFTRIDDSSNSIPGCGIGLALVKELVESHGGTITVESKIDIGSEFTVTLPVIPIDKLPSESERSNSKPANKKLLKNSIEEFRTNRMGLSNTKPVEELVDDNFNHNFNHDFANNDDQDEHQGKKIVLVIEDNFDMRQYVESLLIEQYQVLTAENGQLGLEKALSFIPDLIISDVMMPERDGFELTKALKLDQLSSHIPIILLTAISDRKSRLRAWHEKADEYLVKPFDSEELLLRVNNLLSIRDLLKQSFCDKTWKALRSAGIQDELESDLLTSNLLTSEESAQPTGDEQSSKLKANIPTDEWLTNEKQFVDKIIVVIENNIDNSDLKIDEIASQLYLSKRHFQRKIKGILNISASEFLRDYRLEKAYRLIDRGGVISQVWVDVGFASPSYFSYCFRAKFGISPSEIKGKNQN